MTEYYTHYELRFAEAFAAFFSFSDKRSIFGKTRKPLFINEATHGRILGKKFNIKIDTMCRQRRDEKGGAF